jgi:hypothetical protein
VSLLAAAWLYSGPGETGSFDLTGLGTGDRYAPIGDGELASRGLVNSVASATLDCTQADINLAIFSNPDYTGSFVQLSKAAGGEQDYWHSGPAQSALLMASNNQGHSEDRVSFQDLFRAEWDNFLDQKLSGTNVSREGYPLLTWQMFPQNDRWLSPDDIYLRIHQPLHITMPWYWSDYSASVDYNVLLFVDGSGLLNAWVADYEWWVEPGAKAGKIGDQLDPEARAGMSALQTEINNKLALADLAGPFSDVYLLPGSQLEPVGTTVFFGDTSTDVTIVLQHK